MNLPTKLPYQPIPDEVAVALQDAADIVDHWAEKKGWNAPMDAEQLRAAKSLTALLFTLRPATTLAELARGRWESMPGDDTLNLYPKKYRKLSQLMLIVTEVMECAEAILDERMDDHLPEMSGERAEMADILIRAFHYCGEHGLDIGQALQLKHGYNIQRAERHGGKLA